MTDLPAPARPRFAIVDMLRGIAILAMIAYHLAWDFSYLRFWPINITEEIGWIVFQKLIAGGFLFLVGVGLVLAHGRGMRWPKFWKRFAILAAAAIGVSVVTYFQFGEYFAFFGILHAIALFSLMALPFLFAPVWVAALVGLAVLVLPLIWQSQLFAERWLAWIGFWPEPPQTADLVPIFPWFGVVLLGIVATRLVLASPLAERLARIQARGGLKGLAWLGRWSLIIYLVHQPLLYGGLELLAQQTHPEIAAQASQFIGSCRSQCQANGSDAASCQSYCDCAYRVVDANNLWLALSAPDDAPAKQSAVLQVTGQCVLGAMPE